MVCRPLVSGWWHSTHVWDGWKVHDIGSHKPAVYQPGMVWPYVWLTMAFQKENNDSLATSDIYLARYTMETQHKLLSTPPLVLADCRLPHTDHCGCPRNLPCRSHLGMETATQNSQKSVETFLRSVQMSLNTNGSVQWLVPLLKLVLDVVPVSGETVLAMAVACNRSSGKKRSSTSPDEPYIDRFGPGGETLSWARQRNEG